MAFKHHVVIALEWLRCEEGLAADRLMRKGASVGPNWVFMTDMADAIVDHLGANCIVMHDLPEGEETREHYFAMRMALLAEAIGELEDLLNIR